MQPKYYIDKHGCRRADTDPPIIGWYLEQDIQGDEEAATEFY